ncbi:MAG: hypothetical protein A3F72_12810 [Bacteroidetes bacterium RIFCSPLOWO2_12_FULL_35_15]|nr:MAG: hypothetical protein A3F72_12810 [Bacteroidetes bacterium RIFCSPLOWO2_12_FULL_35_15]
MVFTDYFQSYDNYFWQWEDNADVIAIPNENTIAYRELVIDVFEKIAPQGVPPFGSLLLAIIATNPKGTNSLDVVNIILSKVINQENKSTLNDAIAFLKLLAEVPQQYKEGKKRILLFQTIFERCHNIVSARNSKQIRDTYHTNKHGEGKISNKKEFSLQVFNKDFRTIGLLKNKFQDVNDIINKIASLPDFFEEPLVFTENISEENDTTDFVDQLIANNKTFHVGSLVKRIWSGLNIPVHSALPSQQPLGGFSDLTNKGDFDKLLVSEFANDDIVFLSRLANNEALYIHREVPPTNNNLERIILLDVSLKNWGTPKAIAFATMLAIAKHPKTNIECKAFSIGNSCRPISIENIDTIIDGLQHLEGCLHSADGLEVFFKENPPNKNREIFLITEPSTLKNVGMLKAMNEYHAAINYWIYTDADGNIDVYKKQQNNKKHIQHIQLPIEALWKKESKNNSISQLRNESLTNYPILVRNSMNLKKLISTSDGEVFQITGDKMLLRLFDKSVKIYEKGWEIMYENLPFIAGEFEMGVLPNGEHVLLMFNPQSKEIVLLNINTGEKKNILFIEWKSSATNSFAYHEQKFHHRNNKGVWSIGIDGKIEKDDTIDIEIFTKRGKELKDVAQKYSYAQGVLKNIHHIYINELNNIVFNIHELVINKGYHIKLDKTNFLQRISVAQKIKDNKFVFDDGSSIEINRCGLLILKSSNSEIPIIYIPSVLDASLGVATEHEFAGNEYYYKESQNDVILLKPGPKVLETVRVIKESTSLGLIESRDLVNTTPTPLRISVSSNKANDIKSSLEGIGAKVQIKTLNKSDEQQEEIEKITTTAFFEKHILSFINNIQVHGVKN